MFKDILGKVKIVAQEIKSAARDTATLTKEVIKEKAQALPMASWILTPNEVEAVHSTVYAEVVRAEN